MSTTNVERTDALTELYLDLLKRCLLNLIYEDRSFPQPSDETTAGTSEGVLAKLSAAVLFALSRREPLRPAARYARTVMPRSLKAVSEFDREKRLQGRDFPSQAHTMIGLKRLDNIQALVEDVLRSGTAGDLIETGVWRGGSTIFMRGILKAHGVTDRAVWVADSFEGPPKPDQKGMRRSFSSPEQEEVWRTTIRKHPLAVMAMAAQLRQGTSYEEVREHFTRYDLLDDQVRFLPGWFQDTLPAAPIERLALLRLDGDFYDSTYEALRSLYPKLSDGGYVIVDDYGSFSECRRAVHDYLQEMRSEVKLKRVDDEAVFWQKGADGQ